MPTRKAPQWASLDDVERLADQWTPDILRCRTYGHLWEPQQATYNSKYRYYKVVQICRSCDSYRNMELDSRGHVVSQSIDYADGYLSKGVGRIIGDGRDILRLQTVLKTFDVRKTSKGDRPRWMDVA